MGPTKIGFGKKNEIRIYRVHMIHTQLVFKELILSTETIRILKDQMERGGGLLEKRITNRMR